MSLRGSQINVTPAVVRIPAHGWERARNPGDPGEKSKAFQGA